MAFEAMKGDFSRDLVLWNFLTRKHNQANSLKVVGLNNGRSLSFFQTGAEGPKVDDFTWLCMM